MRIKHSHRKITMIRTLITCPVSRRKSTARVKLKAASQEERIHLWKQHFENLIGKPPKVKDEPIAKMFNDQLDIRLGQFTQEELNLVLRKIKNRKVAGLDEIPLEVGKIRKFDDVLLQHCNGIYSWIKGCILPFSNKGDLRIAKNYRGITITSIAAKIYNALLRNRVEPNIERILRKNQNGFLRNRSATSQILTIRRILGVRAKNLEAILLFVDFSKAIDSIHRGKMEQILFAYCLPNKTVPAIKMLYKNTKLKFCSPDGDTDYFDIVAKVLLGDTIAHTFLLSAQATCFERLLIKWKVVLSIWQRKEVEDTPNKLLRTGTMPMT